MAAQKPEFGAARHAPRNASASLAFVAHAHTTMPRLFVTCFCTYVSHRVCVQLRQWQCNVNIIIVWLRRKHLECFSLSCAVMQAFCNICKAIHSAARLLYSLFDDVLFNECFNQWSLSRPMLSLILLITTTQEQVKSIHQQSVQIRHAMQ